MIVNTVIFLSSLKYSSSLQSLKVNWEPPSFYSFGQKGGRFGDRCSFNLGVKVSWETGLCFLKFGPSLSRWCQKSGNANSPQLILFEHINNIVSKLLFLPALILYVQNCSDDQNETKPLKDGLG